MRTPSPKPTSMKGVACFHFGAFTPATMMATGAVTEQPLPEILDCPDLEVEVVLHPHRASFAGQELQHCEHPSLRNAKSQRDLGGRRGRETPAAQQPAELAAQIQVRQTHVAGVFRRIPLVIPDFI